MTTDQRSLCEFAQRVKLVNSRACPNVSRITEIGSWACSSGRCRRNSAGKVHQILEQLPDHFFCRLSSLAAVTRVLDGSHGSNLKLLTILGLKNYGITRVREVTTVRNFLGAYVRIRDGYAVFKRF